MKILEIIEQLKQLNLSDYPREEILKLIGSIYTAVPIMVVTIPKGKFLYRTRSNDNGNHFCNKNDLSFVPQPNNSSYRRASTPYNTMFYASTSAPNEYNTERTRNTSFKETIDFLREKDSINYSKVTCGMWLLKQDLHLLAMFPYFEKNDGAGFLSDMKESYNKNLRNISQKELSTYSVKFLDFISNEFQKDVKNDYDYMISAIFTELLMKKQSVDGVFYPSVQSDSTCFNIAITPDSVEKLNLQIISEYSVFKKKEQVEFCEDARASVNCDEVFNWIERNTMKVHSDILHKFDSI